jgi:hypothetical protein
MTTKHLSGYYPGGYTLAVGVSRLIIDKTAGVGGTGVDAPHSATIINQGALYGSMQGVLLQAGGSIINGSAQNTSASITGYAFGVRAFGAAAVANFGTIAQGDYGIGVLLSYGGSIANGSARDITAIIQGYLGVRTDGATAAIANFGTIIAKGPKAEAVWLSDGGLLTNGSAQDTAALIQGYSGVIITGAVGTIANFGTINGKGAYSDGVVLAGGSLTNGSVRDITAVIQGQNGVTIEGAATIANFGTIRASEGHYYAGVGMSAGGTLTNGSAQDGAALIQGNFGVNVSGGATIANFGTIEGFGGIAVLLGASNELIAEAGSTFIGLIQGGDGRLVLAGGGAGTISGLGATGKLAGAVDASFSGFGSYEIAAGGAWTLVGSNSLNAGSVLVDEGRLVNRGALTLAGTLSIASSGVFQLAAGNVSAGAGDVTRIVDDGLMIKNAGAGTITVGARTIDDGVVEVATGTLDFTSHLLGTGMLQIEGGATLEVDAAVVSTLSATFDGPAATLALKIPNAFLATIGGLAAGDNIDLLTLAATGASVNAKDQLVVVNGAKTVATLQLSGNYVGAAFSTKADGHGGTNIELASGGGARLPSVYGMATLLAQSAMPAGVTTTRAVAPPHAFITAMAGFGGMMASHATPAEAWAAREPLLSAPRVAIA